MGYYFPTYKPEKLRDINNRLIDLQKEVRELVLLEPILRQKFKELLMKSKHETPNSKTNP